MSTFLRALPDWGKGRLFCFHGEKQPPIDEVTDYVKIACDIQKFYKAASERLPLEEIPKLGSSIHVGGLCFGLADPVSNIILNAIALLFRPPAPSQQNTFQPPAPSQEKTCGWFQIACRSYAGLCAFMTAYFRYLSSAQARRYLSLACYDLPVAIKLVQYDRLPSSEKGCLLPDRGKMKAALRAAALEANHPAPDVLAGLMTAKYPAELLSRILAKVQSKEMLSYGDVSDIRDLLARQWPPNPLQINIEFRCTEPRQLLFSASLGEGVFAHVSVERDDPNDDHLYFSNPTFDYCEQMDGRLRNCPLQSVIGRSKEQAGEMEVDYDAHPCEHILSLKMCMLDTIHGFYIKALARLPGRARSARLLRALLVAGHCYGRMDPVSNIILSTIWYDIAFGADVECPQEIISTRHLSRLVSRSLDGLLAILRPTYKSEHEALYHINSLGCDLSSFLDAGDDECPSTQETSCNNNTLIAAATKAAKHPQHAAFASFLMSLSNQKPLQHLLNMPGRRILDADWDLLNNLLLKESVCHIVPMSPQKDMEPPCCLFSFASLEMFHPSASLASLGTLPPSASLVMDQSASLFMSRETPSFRDRLTFVRSELNKVLCEYCNQHPWEPRYQLDIICGVMESSRSSYNDNSKLYHANFLAKDDDNSSQTEGKLFFAEFWGPEVVPLKQSSCRPINNHSCTGRCSICETEGSMIIHPPSGGHSGVIERSIDLYPSAVFKMLTVGFEDLPLDPDRYVQLSTCTDVPVTPWTPSVQLHTCTDVPVTSWTPSVFLR